MSDAPIEVACKRLQEAQRILVVSHVRPDGDAIGSLLGMGLSLQTAGKEVQMVLADGVPAIFRHLSGSEQVRNQAEGSFDLIAVLDCSDLKRVGSALNGFSVPDLNVDHHPTNLNFARINLVEEEAVATAEMLARYLPAFGFPITEQVASALLFGVITDTLGFRTNNMTPNALRVAADLMEAGGDLPALYYKGLLRRTYEAAQYWGAGLSGLQREGRMVWTTLTMADRRAVGYPGRDDADLINVLASLEDVDVVIVFIEQPGDRIKVSWRSQPGFDVSQVALQFGGGGHKAASGAEIEGSLEEVQAQVLESTRQLFLTEGLA
ncbi:MAG TPA: bifunctional oligoribonuclease/PAP phosphatase NrnA [Anaerolineales bacterium]